ncbi:hypothetical protein AGLY_013081 [Aphis glycines]|uniref:Uncharacterized protein n=1 Tax=Aphis glycines TaxID=307491 RepID=A0A6G0T809_APHGL|nr:hypothetical protein AGLY_013081 [Aphis glycines]
MSSTNLEDFSEIDFVRAAESPLSPHQQWAHSGLRAGASPEQRTDGDQGCRNACVRDDNPIDCKTLSVRRRLAEDLGCCGCTRAPETPCLATDEDASTCCQQRRPATPRAGPETNGSAACGAVDPVQQIIEEGLQRQKKRHHGRRQSSSRSGRPRGGPDRGGRPARGGYQPDYFDDQADMNNWQQHRDHSRRDEPRQRPSSPPPRPRGLAFEPYVDTDPYSPARPSTPGAPAGRAAGGTVAVHGEGTENGRDGARTPAQETGVVSRPGGGGLPVRATTGNDPAEDRRGETETAELQRRYQQQPSSSSDGQCAPATSSAATGCPSAGQRRKLHYQPPSPDTDDECCAPPPPQRRLLKYNPPSSDSSDDDSGNAAGACGGGSRSAAGNDRPSSLQDSSVYYNRSSRNGVPPVTADVPQQTSSLWTSP